MACLGPKTLKRMSRGWTLLSLPQSLLVLNEPRAASESNPVVVVPSAGRAHEAPSGLHQDGRGLSPPGLPGLRLDPKVMPFRGAELVIYLHLLPFLLLQLLILTLSPVVGVTAPTFKDSLGAQPLLIIICTPP